MRVKELVMAALFEWVYPMAKPRTGQRRIRRREEDGEKDEEYGDHLPENSGRHRGGTSASNGPVCRIELSFGRKSGRCMI